MGCAECDRAFIEQSRMTANWMMCGHANEVPTICECPVECVCKRYGCKDRDESGRLHNGFWGTTGESDECTCTACGDVHRKTVVKN
jgi:hypothetical protein